MEIVAQGGRMQTVASSGLSCSDTAQGGANGVDGGGTASLAIDACHKARVALRVATDICSSDLFLGW